MVVVLSLVSLDAYLGPVFFWWPLLVPPDIAHRLEMIQMMLQRLECNIFLLSYRGYAFIGYLY